MVSLHDLLKKTYGGSNTYYTKQTNSFYLPNDLRERGGLVGEPRTPEREVGSSITTSAVLSKDTFTHRKVLVIPRKRWLRPAVT